MSRDKNSRDNVTMNTTRKCFTKKHNRIMDKQPSTRVSSVPRVSIVLTKSPKPEGDEMGTSEKVYRFGTCPQEFCCSMNRSFALKQLNIGGYSIRTFLLVSEQKWLELKKVKHFKPSPLENQEVIEIAAQWP
ncbi:hypothetical protein CRM22_010998 [Opisthorchis felineus]|uniref:Uncharacterized protein n=1 Tax=Opisthorchis felineus TaxID=147828 RepID=A0A4S2KF11_OPIFE|nr:hypothetical protein CRM22_010998 [Opisthorchis felineus]